MPSIILPRSRAASLIVLALCAVASAAARAQGADHPADLATFPRTTLEIAHHGAKGEASRKYPFEVWVADTEPRSEQGLMFVRDLPESMGMVFPLEPPRVENMWMKNTYIELDMLFIGADGRVVKIIEHAKPLSLELLSSEQPVAAVLELRGGAVQKLGLRTGDTVTWKKPAPA
jgi:uncharacterized protein